jgi:ABC-2 type transport system ATP-binding protein
LITVTGLSKTYKVARRAAGLGQAARALFRRDYQVIEALKDVSFTVNAGEIVGYIGPNGAGKSTTVKVLSGILAPDSGECRVMGRVPWQERVEHVREIGVVFGQRSQLWWDVPVIDSFELLRDIYKVSPRSYRNSLELLTAALDLQDLLNTPTRQLSLGQRMRCELAASLLHSPRLLFLDEPTIGLDAVSKIAVRRFIKTVNRDQGVTVILTTHDMNDIEALADRILLIGKGRILYDGDLTDLRSRFVTRKTVTVAFREHSQPVTIPGATLLSWSAERASLSVDIQTVSVSEVIARLSAELDLVDLAVDAPPVEAMIVNLYKEYQI